MRFLLALTFLFSLLQQQTALQAMVIDSAGQPVVGLHIDVQTEQGTSVQLQTDSNGLSAITPMVGSQFVVTRVLQPDGNELEIETTTLDSLQLALLPNQTRTVLFRVSDGVFAVDPETLFAGADTPPTVATMQAALLPAELPAPAGSAPEQAAQPASTESVAEQPATATPIHEQIEPEQTEAEQARGQNLRLIALVAVVLAALIGSVVWHRTRKRGQG